MAGEAAAKIAPQFFLDVVRDVFPAVRAHGSAPVRKRRGLGHGLSRPRWPEGKLGVVGTPPEQATWTTCYGQSRVHEFALFVRMVVNPAVKRAGPPRARGVAAPYGHHWRMPPELDVGRGPVYGILLPV
jgi:hypothetical protein